jgi:drug/metabolite transporter (DMT)-like permease
MSTSDWLLLILLSVFWGGGFFFTAIAVHEIPPVTLALGRVAIAALILLVYLRITGIALPRDATTWLALVIMSLFNNVFPFTLIFWSQTHIASGLAAILNATAPLFTIVIAHLVTSDEKITGARIAGLIAGFVGVVILVGIDALRELGVHVLAQFASLLAALCYAASSVFARRFQGQSPASVSAGLLIVSTFILIPLVALVDRPWTLPAPSGAAMVAMIALAVISTAAAYLIYFRVLARAGATNLILVTFLIPVSAIFLGTVILGEVLELRHMLGMLAIAVGLAAIDGRAPRFLMRLLRPQSA